MSRQAATTSANLARARLRSPRAAATAGLIFSVLFMFSTYLLRAAIPAESGDVTSGLFQNPARVSLVLGFVPVMGIAFLWFMGVARDLLGHLEDQFFSTVFTGSGLLFLALLFVWAAIAGVLLAILTNDPGTVIESGLYQAGRALMNEILEGYAFRMASVYVFSTGSIWFRTAAVPRWLAFITWGTAVLLWFGPGLSWWFYTSFPAWVFLISVYILIVSRRNEAATQAEG